MRALDVLILGGTSEALAIARQLAEGPHFHARYSIAGVTRRPVLPPVEVRVGGFGGPEGLARDLRERRTGLLVDATHPFARQMSANAGEAARATGVPLLAVRRPAWEPASGDRWIRVSDMTAAAAALGPDRRRVLLTVGRKDLAPFVGVPHHRYVVRSVDPPPAELLPPDCTCIAARGPFTLEDERVLIRRHGIEIMVTKNSGGRATAAKLVAARERGLPVVMVDRPPLPAEAHVAADAEGALAWIEAHRTALHHGVSAATWRGV